MISGQSIRPINGAYRAGIVTGADLFLQTKFTYAGDRTTSCPTIHRLTLVRGSRSHWPVGSII